MYVETGLLVALVKTDDWLQEAAVRAPEDRDDVHTSVSAYSEVLVLFYDRERADYSRNSSVTSSSSTAPSGTR